MDSFLPGGGRGDYWGVQYEDYEKEEQFKGRVQGDRAGTAC